MDSDLRFSPPMVAVLAARVRAMVQGPGVVHLHEPRKPQDLWRYVDRFSANFPARPKNLVERPPMQKDVVVITGTTGVVAVLLVSFLEPFLILGSSAIVR